MEKLYNVSEVAEMLGVSASFIYKKAESGQLEAVRIGSALRFSESGIQAFVEKCKILTESKSDTQAHTAFNSVSCFLG
jgi:excisionase family DNA binding protein